MHSRKLNGLILAVVTSIVLVTLTLMAYGSGMPMPELSGQTTLVADGNPFPPLPPPTPKPPSIQSHG